MTLFRPLCRVAIGGVMGGLMATSVHGLTIVPTNDAFGLANTLFLNQTSFAIQSATLNSAAQVVAQGTTTQLDFQAGTYQNFAGTYGLPLVGIALSSGNIADYATGPNTGDRTTEFLDDFLEPIPATPDQNALLSPLSGQSSHFDVVDLTISFFNNSAANTATFFATFGSEEWPDFVNSGFNDAFGLFVNGVNYAGVLPTGGVPGDPLLPVNINHPDMTPIPGTELNAVIAPNGNPVLRFDVPIDPGALNEFRIILADASDAALDSTVYLSSFFSESVVAPPGATEFNPVLPSNPPDPVTGAWLIELPEVPEGTIVWIDPVVSVGFEYEIAGAEFETVTAPSLATVPDLDGYFITVGGDTLALLPGQTLDFFDSFGLNPTFFTLTGIDPTLGLDPENPLAFPTGISFINPTASVITVTMTPITADIGNGNGDVPPIIPLPAAGWLLLSALGGLALARRRRG